MKANEFIREAGLFAFSTATKLLKERGYKYLVVYEDEIDFTNEAEILNKDYTFDMREVKRLVESHKIVEKMGGLEKAKSLANSAKNISWVHLTDQALQAIADVESCL